MFLKTLSLLIFSVLFISCNHGNENTKQSLPQNSSLSQQQKIAAVDYYKVFNGHKVKHLDAIYRSLKENGCERFIFYAGDSSLDNKYWILPGNQIENVENYQDDQTTGVATNGYENILEPKRMVKDVDYWMNYFLASKKYSTQKACSIMTSVEATKLADRKNSLLEQDNFIKDHITENDFLIVSIGGNDVALGPSDDIKRAIQKLSQDPNDRDSLDTILSIVKDDTKTYIERLISKNKPKKVLVSMIYYPDEHDISGFARDTLQTFQYLTNPRKLQSFIDRLYQLGTKQISISKTNVVPIELSKALDGKDTRDYINAVEPSVSGGKKMAQYFLENLFGRLLVEVYLNSGQTSIFRAGT